MPGGGNTFPVPAIISWDKRRQSPVDSRNGRTGAAASVPPANDGPSGGPDLMRLNVLSRRGQGVAARPNNNCKLRRFRPVQRRASPLS